MADNRNPSRNQTERAKPGVTGALTTRDFSQKVAKFEEQFARLIPNQLKKTDILTAKRVAGLLVNAFSQSEELRACRPSTILNAAGLACAVGLEFNNSLGQSAIIPYDNNKKVGGQWVTLKEAQWQMMYRGGITLALRSGQVAHVTAEAVMENDEFDYQYGSKAFLMHRPAERWGRDFKLEENWRKAYCFVRFKDGGEHFRVMDRQQIEDIRDKSSKGKDNERMPWKTWLEEMIRKTPTKNEMKYLDLTPQLAMAVGLDDAAEAGASQDQVIDWKDYSAEDIDHETKPQTQGVGESQPHGGKQQQTPSNGGNGNDGSEPEPPPTLWPEQQPDEGSRKTVSGATTGPFHEESFSAADFESLLNDFKNNGFGSTKAQFIAFLSKWPKTAQDLVNHVRGAS
jgi:recombination protein RecT